MSFGDVPWSVPHPVTSNRRWGGLINRKGNPFNKRLLKLWSHIRAIMVHFVSFKLWSQGARGAWWSCQGPHSQVFIAIIHIFIHHYHHHHHQHHHHHRHHHIHHRHHDLLTHHVFRFFHHLVRHNQLVKGFQVNSIVIVNIIYMIIINIIIVVIDDDDALS